MFTITEIEAFCARWYGGRALLLTPYAYTTTFSLLAPLGVATNIISIQANADFIALSISHRAQIDAAQNVSTKTAPFVRVLITDSGTNEQWTSAGVDLENYSMNDGKARFLPYPRILSGRSSQSVQLTNYATIAETYETIDIVLGGVLVRAYAQQNTGIGV